MSKEEKTNWTRSGRLQYEAVMAIVKSAEALTLCRGHIYSVEAILLRAGIPKTDSLFATLATSIGHTDALSSLLYGLWGYLEKNGLPPSKGKAGKFTIHRISARTSHKSKNP